MIAGIKKKSAKSATKISLAVNTPKSNILYLYENVRTKNPRASTIDVSVIALPVPIKVNLTALSTSLY